MSEAVKQEVTLARLGEKIDGLSSMIERHMTSNEKDHTSIETGMGVLSERVRKNENAITEIKTKQTFINIAQGIWAPVASILATLFGGNA